MQVALPGIHEVPLLEFESQVVIRLLVQGTALRPAHCPRAPLGGTPPMLQRVS